MRQSFKDFLVPIVCLRPSRFLPRCCNFWRDPRSEARCVLDCRGMCANLEN